MQNFKQGTLSCLFTEQKFAQSKPIPVSDLGKLAVCAAICNMLLLPFWRELYGPVFVYFFPYRLPIDSFLLDLGFFFAVGVVLLYFYGGRALGFFPSLAGVLAAWSVCVTAEPLWYGRGDPWFLLLVAISAAVVFWSLNRFARLRIAFEFGCFIILLFTICKVVMVWRETRSFPVERPGRSYGIFFEESREKRIITRESGNKIILIIFDELDQRLTLESGFSYPEFQRLASGSLVGTAVTPANYRTMAAIPSILCGRPFRPNEFTTNSGRQWGAESLPAEFGKQGLTSAVLGWYNPYCRVFGNQVSRCFTAQWHSAGTAAYLSGAPFLTRLAKDAGAMLRAYPLAVPLYRLATRRNGIGGLSESVQTHREIYDALQQRLGEFLALDSNFLFLHLPVPHTPGIRLQAGTPGGDYLDNMAIADETLGYIRRLLEHSGRWNDSTVLVMGDHHFRYDLWRDQSPPRVLRATGREDPRVVFLLKLPSNSVGASYVQPFNAMLTHDLIVLLMAGKLKSNTAVTHWLDSNRTRFPVSAPRQD